MRRPPPEVLGGGSAGRLSRRCGRRSAVAAGARRGSTALASDHAPLLRRHRREARVMRPAFPLEATRRRVPHQLTLVSLRSRVGAVHDVAVLAAVPRVLLPMSHLSSPSSRCAPLCSALGRGSPPRRHSTSEHAVADRDRLRLRVALMTQQADLGAEPSIFGTRGRLLLRVGAQLGVRPRRDRGGRR